MVVDVPSNSEGLWDIEGQELVDTVEKVEKLIERNLRETSSLPELRPDCRVYAST